MADQTVGDVVAEASRAASESAQRSFAPMQPPPSAESVARAHARGGAPNRPIGVIDILHAQADEANARAAGDREANAGKGAPRDGKVQVLK